MQTLNLNISLLNSEYKRTFVRDLGKTIRDFELNFSVSLVHRIEMGGTKPDFGYGSQRSIYLGKSEKGLFLARLWQKELSAERKLP